LFIYALIVLIQFEFMLLLLIS